MPRVDFYILADDDEDRRRVYLCRVVDKAYRLGHRVWIHAPDAAHAEALDERLWTFSQESFVGHDRAGGGTTTGDTPVVIGDAAGAGADRALLVNEDAEVPADAARFERIAEIVNSDAAVRRRGRTHFQYYRDQGFELHHHQVD